VEKNCRNIGGKRRSRLHRRERNGGGNIKKFAKFLMVKLVEWAASVKEIYFSYLIGSF
jgi:hypothetical protein